MAINFPEIPEPPKEKKKIGRKVLGVILVIWIANSLFSSNMFESVSPTIEIEEAEFWNMKDPIKLKIKDNVGIKSYKITIDKGVGDLETFAEETFEDSNVTELDFNITIKKGRFKSSYTNIFVEVEDTSLANFFSGNVAKMQSSVTVDKIPPKVYMISNSYGIRRAGSAVVVFGVEEDNVDEIYIETESGVKFKPQPFLNKGGKVKNYISLVAWPIKDDKFSAFIIAKDKAGNRSSQYLSLYLKEKNYKRSNINLKTSFLTGKIKQLVNQYDQQAGYIDSPAEHFRIVNEEIRKENESLIYDFASKIDQDKVVSEFNIKPFTPLKGSRSVASFGDHRHYYYNGNLISQSMHMGLDMASIARAPIITSNDGVVLDTSDKGIYGNSPIIDHGLGLTSIYAHCSNIRVNVGDKVQAGSIIANSGKSGLALGDHLHFGIYVQGIPVRPEEWMDDDWIKDNITDIIATAKQMIERQ
jgi:murein DD-endopeptidase MepM/ murein hydrolase activator NlpD